MPSSLVNFPLATISDGVISYLQFLFGSRKHTPEDYRWSPHQRQTRVTISGPFVFDNERPMAAPFIIVERTPFTFDNRVLDNLKSAKENVFLEDEKVLIADGGITLKVGAGAASEASSIANYLAIQLQADRKGIMQNLGFVRNLNIVDVGSEIPIVKDSEVKRWEVTLRLQVSMQMGWKDLEVDPVKWKSLAMRTVSKEKSYHSDVGVVTTGSANLEDPSANFGLETTNVPQLLKKELDKGWYYVRFDGDEKLYNVESIVNKNKLSLSYHDANDEKVPFNPPESSVNKKYNLLWNEVHLHIELPRK